MSEDKKDVKEEKKCCGGGKCEVGALSVDQTEELKVSAKNLGLDPNVIADIVTKWGGIVLGLAVEALRSGFTQAFVMDMLNKLGPAALQFILHLFNKKKMMAMDGIADQLPKEIDLKKVGAMDASILILIVEQFLPVIFEQFGPQILKAVEDALLSALKNNSK